MKRMIFQADEQLLDRLRRHARDQGVSVAEVIRRAVEKEVGPAEQRRKPLSLGTFESGETDLSVRVEELYEPPPWR